MHARYAVRVRVQWSPVVRSTCVFEIEYLESNQTFSALIIIRRFCHARVRSHARHFATRFALLASVKSCTFNRVSGFKLKSTTARWIVEQLIRIPCARMCRSTFLGDLCVRLDHAAILSAGAPVRPVRAYDVLVGGE
jgi:hypothetical protein